MSAGLPWRRRRTAAIPRSRPCRFGPTARRRVQFCRCAGSRSQRAAADGASSPPVDLVTLCRGSGALIRACAPQFDAAYAAPRLTIFNDVSFSTDATVVIANMCVPSRTLSGSHGVAKHFPISLSSAQIPPTPLPTTNPRHPCMPAFAAAATPPWCQPPLSPPRASWPPVL